MVDKVEDKAGEKESQKITFKCSFCGQFKPLGDMMILTRFFPRLVACRDCERQLR